MKITKPELDLLGSLLDFARKHADHADEADHAQNLVDDTQAIVDRLYLDYWRWQSNNR